MSPLLLPLSYIPLAEGLGLEPRIRASKAPVLPLHHPSLAPQIGFEPITERFCSAPWIRTKIEQINSLWHCHYARADHFNEFILPLHDLHRNALMDISLLQSKQLGNSCVAFFSINSLYTGILVSSK